LNTENIFNDDQVSKTPADSFVNPIKEQSQEKVNDEKKGNEKIGERPNVEETQLTNPITSDTEPEKIDQFKSVVKKVLDKTVRPGVKKIKQATSSKIKNTKVSGAASKAPAVKTIQPEKVKRIRKTSASVNVSALRKITFQIKFHSKPGQSLGVTGNHPLLGTNDVTKAFPLQYLNTEYWFGTLNTAQTETLPDTIYYKYFVKDEAETITLEWGEDKIIQTSLYNAEEIRLIDSWNSAAFIENTFYTEPFKKVLLKNNYTLVKGTKPENYTHIFKVKAPLLLKGEALCIIGSVPALGEWNTDKPMLLSRKENEDWHTVKIDLSASSFPLEYKYGVYDINEKKFVQYEGDKNRFLYDDPSQTKVTVVTDGFAVLPNNGFKGAGVAIPVFSLRSEKGLGVGEFNDLKLMVDWAKEVGLKLVQLLPVNDTTATYTKADSYPYAAISAFALHPLYLHLPAIVSKQNEKLLSTLTGTQKELNSKAEVAYEAVMEAKWSFIEKIFPSQKKLTFRSPGFKSFFNDNAHWLVSYAAFCYLRNKYKTADFMQWQTNQTYDANEIAGLAASPSDAVDEISINYFVQYNLHLQLKEATDYAHANGIIVKGDIPIGIYRHSCDAWQQPYLYKMDMQAGAPPDDFAVKGQNWGFPTYNWQQMQQDSFAWWKKRFKQMSYYFDAFRIDHILGFFRIWSIPMDAVEGIMGRFVPALPIHINEFAERSIAFSYDRFCKPFISDPVLHENFGHYVEKVKAEFLQPSDNGSYTLKSEFDTQRKVDSYFLQKPQDAESQKIKQGLFNLISNVILFAEGTEGTHFHFRISIESTSSFRYLDGNMQHKLRDLYVNYFFRRQDNFWYQEAMDKLPELKRSTNMLICGEDLGMVPDCVPGVMKELAILSLEIQRMPKNPAHAFFHPDDAPYLSVVTPSTHDMSTIRGWWEEDRAVTQQFFNQELGQGGTAPSVCEPWINQIIIKQHLYSPAMWSIFQLQDLLGMDGEIRRDNPNKERINIPADPKHYWCYRKHVTLEDLMNQTSFNTRLKKSVLQAER